MFATVARPHPRGRRAAALCASLVLNGSLVLGLAQLRPAERAADLAEAPIERMVELVLPRAPEPPGPPARRPVSRPASAGGTPSRPPAPAPELPTTPPVLAPAVDVAEALPPSGPPGPGGEGPEGPPGTPGWGEGEGGGGGGGGHRTVHWSQVQARSKVQPQYPPAAAAMGYRTEESCILRLRIDAEGVPTAVEVRRCAPPFQRVAVEAARKWRFYPLLEDGRPVSSQFDLNFRFRPSGAAAGASGAGHDATPSTEPPPQ